MILEEITVKYWRGYREPHTFHFDAGFNLLVGNNEAGKSTLFEVLTRVLFDRHTAGGQDIQRMQPMGSDLSPEAILAFRVNGQRHRAVKRFLNNATSALYTERNGRWELDAEGDAADARIRAILHGATPGRTAKAEHRGLAEALWYIQGDLPIPEVKWSQAVCDGLTGVIGHVARSPRESSIIKSITERHNLAWTPTGRQKSTGELAQLQESIKTLEQQIGTLQEQGQAVQTFQRELEQMKMEMADKKHALEHAQGEKEEARRRAEEAPNIEAEKGKREEAQRLAEQRLVAMQRDLDQIKKLQADILGATANQTRAANAVSELEADARRELADRDLYRKQWEEELKPTLDGIEAQLSALQAVKRLGELREKRRIMDRHHKKVSAARNSLVQLENDLASLLAPTKKEHDRYQTLINELAIAEGQIAVSGIRVLFRLDDPSATVIATPAAEQLPDSGEYLIGASTTFTLGGIGSIGVRGGGDSLSDLNGKAIQLRRERDETHARFQVANDAQLAERYETRRQMEADRKNKKMELTELTEEGEPTQADLLAIDRSITEEESKAQAAPPDGQALTGEALQAELRRLEKEKRDVSSDIKTRQESEAIARDAHQAAVEKATTARTEATTLAVTITQLQKQSADVIGQYGTVQQLNQQIEIAGTENSRLQEDLTRFMQTYEERVALPKKLWREAENRVQALQEQESKIRLAMKDRMARIEQIAATDSYSKLGDFEAELVVARRGEAVMQRRANAIKLLHEMVKAYESEQTGQIAGPIADTMREWLAVLTDGTYGGLGLNDTLVPTGVRAERYDADMPLNSLSYGTHEQIVVLLRLAMGMLLSKTAPQLVVIDDCLVNSDAVRMQRLRLILKQAVEKGCQIVVATCNDTPYAGLEGRTIRVPVDGLRQDTDARTGP